MNKRKEERLMEIIYAIFYTLGIMLFVFLYSLVVTAIGIFVSYHLMMGEQERIDKHGFTL